MDHQKLLYEETAEILKALAHPIRLCIVQNLLEQQTSGVKPANVTQMQSCLSIPQSTLSQHLQKLRAAGIVTGKRQGLEVTYEILDTRIIGVLKCFFEKEAVALPNISF